MMMKKKKKRNPVFLMGLGRKTAKLFYHSCVLVKKHMRAFDVVVNKVLKFILKSYLRLPCTPFSFELELKSHAVFPC